MTQFYLPVSALPFVRSFLLFAFFLCAFYMMQGQVYYANLAGSNEFPANSSPGTGKALVTITGNFMRVQATFSGLVAQTSTGLPSGTTASHIHAPTPVPLSLITTAGVATTTPTFTGFPSGVRAGTYDHVFDMTLASSYNPAYINANGGTPASAFTALKTAIAAGRSYFNIHTNAFPSGEIRGFLLACPTITVSIADAFALSQGVLANTVYPAYAPAASLTLQASVSGGTGPYSYSWSNGIASTSIIVSPTSTTTYSVTVTDQNGCPGNMASKTINVMNIAGGNKGQNIVVCHKARNSLAVGAAGVADHLGHGDMLGSCSGDVQSVASRETVAEQFANLGLTVKVLSNPSPNYFEIQLSGKANNLQLRVYDLHGRVVETKSSLQSNQTLRIGTSYAPGIYILQLTQGKEMQTIRLIKAK